MPLTEFQKPVYHKVFDGKPFRYATTNFSKTEANKAADSLRRRGFLARVVKMRLPAIDKGPGHTRMGYLVFTRKGRK